MTTTTTEHGSDRARLADLLPALGASDIALRREQCRGELGDYAIIGKSGWIYPDGNGWLLYVETSYRDDDTRELIEGAVRRWNNIKARLAFCRLTVDGDDEGTFRLDRLPTPVEADAIREALGIRKRRNLSPEALERAKIALGLARSRVKSTSHGQRLV